MNIHRSLVWAVLGASVSCIALAQSSPMPQVGQRAEVLTQQQIEVSHDVTALTHLRQLYQASGDKQRYRWAMQRLIELIPGSLPLKLELAASYAADDMKTPAYDLLLRMKGQGFGLELGQDPRFQKIHGTQVWDFIVKSLKVNLKPFGEGSTAFDLPAGDLMFNALAWDPLKHQFLAGSARDGGIYHADRYGKITDFIKSDKQNQLWSVLDLAVDNKHQRLWVATTAVVYFRGYDTDNAGQAALLEFDLASGKLLHRYPLKGSGKFLSSLALSADGAVFAADGVNRVIYQLKGGKLAQLATNPRLNDIRAIAVSSDGKNLYLADTIYGVIGYDLSAHKAFNLQYNPASLVLPGIVDMHWYDDTLIVTEPGMQPQRVMRLKLSRDGHTVTSAMPLDVAHPEFSALGNGTLVGDKLYYLTSDQREKYDSHGLLKDGAVLQSMPVFESDARFAWDQSGINTGLSSIPNTSPGDARKLLAEPTGKHSLPRRKQPNLLMKKPQD